MSAPAGPPVANPRLFTVEQADRLVPLLARTFRALALDRRALHAVAAELSPYGVDLAEPPPPAVASRPELREPLARLANVRRRMSARLARLADMGVEVKGIEGLVDLRSRYQGRVVYLCWKLGERRFTHWHELDHGFAGRQAIVDRAAFEGTLLN